MLTSWSGWFGGAVQPFFVSLGSLQTLSDSFHSPNKCTIGWLVTLNCLQVWMWVWMVICHLFGHVISHVYVILHLFKTCAIFSYTISAGYACVKQGLILSIQREKEYPSEFQTYLQCQCLSIWGSGTLKVNRLDKSEYLCQWGQLVSQLNLSTNCRFDSISCYFSLWSYELGFDLLCQREKKVS